MPLELNYVRCAQLDAHQEQWLKRAAEAVFRGEGLTKPCFAMLTLCDGTAIRRINRETRGVDAITDVLSFPNAAFPAKRTARQAPDAVAALWDPDLAACDLGEIYLCVPRAREQAAEYGHSFDRELCYLTVHGLNHLCGYDHMTNEEKQIMRIQEEKVMAELGLSRPDKAKMLALAVEAMAHSYSPYSRFAIRQAPTAKRE